MTAWDGTERRLISGESEFCSAHSAHVLCMSTVAEEVKTLKETNNIDFATFKWTISLVVMLILGLATIPVIVQRDRDKTLSDVQVEQRNIYHSVEALNKKIDLLIPIQNDRIRSLEKHSHGG